MKREAPKQFLAKAVVGLSLIGGTGLWMLDEYVEMDVMQQATASVSEETTQNSASLQPVTDENGEPVQLAQTVRGRVNMNRVRINPGLKEDDKASEDGVEKIGELPAAPGEAKTLEMPPMDLGAQKAAENKELEDEEPSLQELIDELRKAKAAAKVEEQKVAPLAGAKAVEEPVVEKPLSLGPSRLERKHPTTELPPPVALPNEKELECNQELAVYEAQLVARERSLLKAYEALQTEKDRVLQMQALVEERWATAQDSWDTASVLMERSETVCVGEPPKEDDRVPLNLGIEQVDPEVRVTQVVQIVKSMKPKAAARVIERWNSPLAATALKRLSPRVSSKILAELPKEVAQKLTVDLVKGKEHQYEGATPQSP